MAFEPRTSNPFLHLREVQGGKASVKSSVTGMPELVDLNLARGVDQGLRELLTFASLPNVDLRLYVTSPGRLGVHWWSLKHPHSNLSVFNLAWTVALVESDEQSVGFDGTIFISQSAFANLPPELKGSALTPGSPWYRTTWNGERWETAAVPTGPPSRANDPTYAPLAIVAGGVLPLQGLQPSPALCGLVALDTPLSDAVTAKALWACRFILPFSAGATISETWLSNFVRELSAGVSLDLAHASASVESYEDATEFPALVNGTRDWPHNRQLAPATRAVVERVLNEKKGEFVVVVLSRLLPHRVPSRMAGRKVTERARSLVEHPTTAEEPFRPNDLNLVQIEVEPRVDSGFGKLLRLFVAPSRWQHLDSYLEAIANAAQDQGLAELVVIVRSEQDSPGLREHLNEFTKARPTFRHEAI